MQTARITGPEALGAILREARVLNGLTQDQLATHLGVSRRYVIEMEQGKPTKALDRLFDYMQETGVRLYGDIHTSGAPDD